VHNLEFLGIGKVGGHRASTMQDETGATGEEVNRAIEALTRSDLLRLKHFAVWRFRGLGRARCGRTWEDLLSEAKLSTLKGAANNGSGRRWNQNVDLVTHLVGAMRSISSHWKRDFDEQEADLETEIVTRNAKGDWISPLDHVASNDPSQERYLSVRDVLDKLSRQFPTDSAADRVVAGWKRDLPPSAIMQSFKLTKSEYERAVRQIRLCLLNWGWWPKLKDRLNRGRRR
jgi:hypothetical protein